MMKVLVLTKTECDYDYMETKIVRTFTVEDDFDLDVNYKLWDQETGVKRVVKNQYGSWPTKWACHHSKSFEDWLTEKLPKIEHVEWNV